MLITCLQKNLSKGLAITSHLSSLKTSLPILSNVLIKAKKEGVWLITTNLEIAIKTQIGAKVEKEGKITIPALLFYNLINLLSKEDQIKLELKDENLAIFTKNKKTLLRSIPAEEFPIIPSITKKGSISLKGLDFKRAVEKVIFAISPTETRPEISGMLLSYQLDQPKKITLVGTDSYRLAEKKLNLSESDLKKDLNVIIPVKTIQELIRTLEEEDLLKIYFAENQILFSYGNTEITSRIMGGTYPNYREIIPQNFKTVVTLPKETFLRAVRSAGLFSKIGINDISLKILKNQTIISSVGNQLGEDESKIDSQTNGQEMEIVFNYHYLTEGISNLEGEEIELNLLSDSSPAILKSEDKNYLYLAMPIKQ